MSGRLGKDRTCHITAFQRGWSRPHPLSCVHSALATRRCSKWLFKKLVGHVLSLGDSHKERCILVELDLAEFQHLPRGSQPSKNSMKPEADIKKRVHWPCS